MQRVAANLDETKVAVPTELVQNKRQSLAFALRHAGEVEIEDLAGAVLRKLETGRAAIGLQHSIFGVHQLSDIQGNELLAFRLHRIEQSASLKRDVGQRSDCGRRGLEVEITGV